MRTGVPTSGAIVDINTGSTPLRKTIKMTWEQAFDGPQVIDNVEHRTRPESVPVNCGKWDTVFFLFLRIYKGQVNIKQLAGEFCCIVWRCLGATSSLPHPLSSFPFSSPKGFSD